MSRLDCHFRGNQGLLGAFQQYWDVESKARLYRKNSFFEDKVNISNKDAIEFCILFLIVAIAIISCWMIGGLL